MSSNQDIMEKRHAFTDCEDKYVCKVRRNDHNYRQVYEYDKKMKREIANSNERRRMQSINIGFETLKQLLPMTMDGEKLSKASILQFTAKYIQSLIARLTTLEKEVACYKKSMLNSKDKIVSSKSTSAAQDLTRKRRLNSCNVDFENAQTENHDSKIVDFNISASFPSLNPESSLTSCPTSEKTPGSLEHLVAAIEQVEGEKFYVASVKTSMNVQILKEELNNDSCSIIESNNDSFEILEPQPNLISNVDYVLNNTDNKKPSNSNNSNCNNNANSSVMKPTISPYTEKIILAVSQHPHMFENRTSNYNLMPTQPTHQIVPNDQLIDPAGFNQQLTVTSTSQRVPQKYLHRSEVEFENNRSL